MNNPPIIASYSAAISSETSPDRSGLSEVVSFPGSFGVECAPLRIGTFGITAQSSCLSSESNLVTASFNHSFQIERVIRS
jgi:hypothetical protein